MRIQSQLKDTCNRTEIMLCYVLFCADLCISYNNNNNAFLHLMYAVGDHYMSYRGLQFISMVFNFLTVFCFFVFHFSAVYTVFSLI